MSADLSNSHVQVGLESLEAEQNVYMCFLLDLGMAFLSSGMSPV